LRELEQRVVLLAQLLQHFVAHVANDLRARIEVLVDAMAETHETEVAGLVLGHRQVFGNLFRRADFLEHFEHGFVGSTVCRAPQRRHAGGNRGVRIGAGRTRQPHGRRAGVLFVVGMQDEQEIERFGSDRIDDVLLAGNRKEHVQHVRAVVEVIARIDERLAERMFVGRRRDGRQLGHDAMGENLPMTRVMDVHRVVIERRHRGHHRGHHGHRVRVVMEAAKESQQ
jgi:hypothetical protein